MEWCQLWGGVGSLKWNRVGCCWGLWLVGFGWSSLQALKHTHCMPHLGARPSFIKGTVELSQSSAAERKAATLGCGRDSRVSRDHPAPIHCCRIITLEAAASPLINVAIVVWDGANVLEISSTFKKKKISTAGFVVSMY